MASSYLGPESPRPLSVISETYQKRLQLPEYPDADKFTFGRRYEEAMVQLIHKYLELGTTDRLCYVGDQTGSLVPLLQERFCLLEPMTAVLPGHVHYVETDYRSIVPIHIANTGAEEFFRQKAEECKENKNPLGLFDRVILKDAITGFADPVATYKNIMRCCGPLGKVLIIHRAGNLNTLPLFLDAKQRIGNADVPYGHLLKDLYSCNFDVRWDIEYVPIRMPKTKWLTMLREKFPPELQIVSNFEIFSGVRELSEGMLKYEGDEVEFVDRLLFISASAPFTENAYPSVQRIGANRFRPFPTLESYALELEVTDGLREMVPRLKTK